MTFYRDMQGIAGDLLEEFDQGPLCLLRETPGDGPDWDPGESPESLRKSIPGTVRGVSDAYVDGTLVVSTDLQCTIPGGRIEPKMTDRIEVNGQAHQIVRIDPRPASGTVVAYIVIIRK